ncbi:hypothetical protein BAE44_0003943 [Dichanthelium oligosanthes]|uniref:Uncharacterized protein n=1 Tax=Dichanthelium oligosanthes TaxID=888268 RepID=A0A1E5WCJ8_9POAL|nr:hypothetical protein BAE44_0003943 [Dichanthelium oligosanthes]
MESMGEEVGPAAVCQSMEEDVGPAMEEEPEREDLSETCRLDRYCAMCVRAFCSHCCAGHHSSPGCHDVIPVGRDAAGQPCFPTHYPGSTRPIPDFIADRMGTADYVTPLARDAYCLNCMAAFCSSACHHHHRDCGRDLILRVEERGGRPCVPCRGDEEWLAFLESVVGDPVGEDDGSGMMLLPLLWRKPGACFQCGGPVPRPLWSCCSPVCATSHNREVTLRRERRDARRAAHLLAKLHIDGPNQQAKYR